MRWSSMPSMRRRRCNGCGGPCSRRQHFASSGVSQCRPARLLVGAGLSSLIGAAIAGGAIIMTNLFKSILHNIGVVIVGFALDWVGTIIDSLLGFSTFSSLPAKWVGSLVLALGFLLRVWATVHFYSHRMRVISLKPQGTLITSGPYRFSRNPLYLGGNVFIFFGAALFLGSPTALFATALHLPLMDRFIRREEERLERRFGEEWRSY